jgi:hypothetical protein
MTAGSWLRSVLGGLAVTLLGVLGARYQSVVDRGPDWVRAAAVAASLGISPFWWICRQLTPLFHGPNAWLLAGAMLANVAVWTVAAGAAVAVFRRARLR